MTSANTPSSNPAFVRKPAFWIIALGLMLALWLGFNISPTPYVEIVPRDVVAQDDGSLAFSQKGKLVEIPFPPVAPQDSKLLQLREANRQAAAVTPTLPEGLTTELVRRTSADGASNSYEVVSLRHHYRIWSLFPALIAILLCWTTREPLSALLGGVVAGAFLLGHRNVVDAVIVQELATTRAAEVIILYLFLLGGILGIWSRTGASHAFAEWVSDRYVRGPKSARFVAWLLGVLFFQGGTVSTVLLFFQGGTVSTVLVGSTVKPLSDRHKISHEELAYIVDSTASPIASQIAVVHLRRRRALPRHPTGTDALLSGEHFVLLVRDLRGAADLPVLLRQGPLGRAEAAPRHRTRAPHRRARRARRRTDGGQGTRGR